MPKKTAAKKAAETTFASIPLSALQPNTYNARRFEENMTPQRRARFDELVASVREKGILEPLVVRPVAAGRYEIIAGERRYRAALEVAKGKKYEVPCMVRDVDDDAAFDIMLIENLHRDDLTPFETAYAFRAFLERYGDDAAADLSARTGVPIHGIRRQVRVLSLPEPVQEAWRDGTITQSHAELFTRVADEEKIAELLAACQRLKLSVRELAERIGTISPELDKGFFDKAECQTCQFNTSVQSGLFPDNAPGGKCGNPACFEQKQGAFLTENWPKSKVAEKFGTRGFRFGHRLEKEHRQPPPGMETCERCTGCDTFISVLRLTGVVVSGYERTCLGPRECFDELYAPPPPKEETEPSDADVDAADKQLGEALAAAREKRNPDPAKPEEKTEPSRSSAPPEETGPVFNDYRGEQAREKLIKEILPERVKAMPSGRTQVLRLELLALALSSTAVKTHLGAALGVKNHATPQQWVKPIFEVPAKELADHLRDAALAQVMNDFTLPAEVRRLVSERFDVDLAREWTLTRDYLEKLTKSEIVRIGEEPGVALWKDKHVGAYRDKHHEGKALLSLKKDDLLDLVFKSGAPLKGRVPREVLGKQK